MFRQARAVLVFVLFGLNVLCPMAVVLADSNVESEPAATAEVPIELIESETRIEFKPVSAPVSASKKPSARDLRRQEIEARTLELEEVFSQEGPKAKRAKMYWMQNEDDKSLPPTKQLDMVIAVYSIEGGRDVALIFAFSDGKWIIMPYDFR